MAMAIRFLVLILSLAAFVLALVGTIPTPLYENNLGMYALKGSAKVTLWEITNSDLTDTDIGVTTTNDLAVRVNYSACSSFRLTWRALEALAIAGVLIGLFAFIMSLLQTFGRRKVKLPMFLFFLIAFLVEAILVIISAMSLDKVFCKNEAGVMASFKACGYSFGIGFILHIAAAVGYLVCLILTPFTQALWCGSW